MRVSYTSSSSNLSLRQLLQALQQEHPDTFPFLQKTANLLPLKAGGLWVQHPDKPIASSQKLVSIITVVKDDPSGLENTITSVLSQSYAPIECIIIDGASLAVTHQVIQKYDQKIHFWLSYPDHGIYDAMNRGALLARGNWLLFMNGGDSFYRSTSLAELIQHCNDTSELAYGDHDILYTGKNYSRIHRVKPIRSYYDLWHHMGFCHQSLIVRRKLVHQRLFDISNLSADYKFVLQCFLAGHRFQHIPVIVSRVNTDGVSQRRRIYMEWERWRVSWELRPHFWLPFGFAYIFFSTSLRLFIQKLAGERITGIILRVKYYLLDRLSF